MGFNARVLCVATTSAAGVSNVLSCKSDFPATLRVFCEASFWEELKEAEAVIAPLSLASYRLQRDETRLETFIEKRWAKCKQPLFMLGFALHPEYVAVAKDLPETDVSGIGTLTKIAVYYHRRQLATADLGELRRDMISRMRGEFTNIKATEFRAPWEYWDAVAVETPSSVLPKLPFETEADKLAEEEDEMVGSFNDDAIPSGLSLPTAEPGCLHSTAAERYAMMPFDRSLGASTFSSGSCPGHHDLQELHERVQHAVLDYFRSRRTVREQVGQRLGVNLLGGGT
ncbi:hypothetical protein PPTG_11843 [Phytophthora nicotianae INRA-310]|uniref:Uncharacterized protein n=1 Tax=Phytophthora nicotianae (strain INRA-310) TaxID=761204 RepID=W2QA84_PHYN3|nr:hypothetical protein PPTG_11843 [Phytophthora nicotianae INRA-310]ETN09449.1 hypothetical protein PPTG_11843 [Phytophthora nicotianae INRA-310]